MSHLDEGTLHALLDGELDAKEVRQIQAHLGSCTACGTRLQSVKDVLAESDRLVGVLQFPGTPDRPDLPHRGAEPGVRTPIPEPVAESDFTPAEPLVPGEEAGEAADEEPPVGRSRPAERRFPSEPVYHEAPPVLLVPDDSRWAERRRRMLSGMRWAAVLLVTLGAGYIASEMRRVGSVPPQPAASPAAGVTDETPVLSAAEETARPDSLATPTANRPEPAPPPAGDPAASAPADRREAAAPFAMAAPAEEDRQKAAIRSEEAPPPPPPEREQVAAGEPQEALGEEPASPHLRQEAAEALADLDRQRRVERAAVATAALDASRRRAGPPAETAPAPPPAPAPRTLEQRSGIYLRIGLDEAARQLGRPVHVIEGMQQQFMGLVQGVTSPAADPTRPVVRVVYQDSQGRMILLDQQRIRPGQTWGASETRWVAGEIGLALLGEPGPEVLRNLRPRVR